MLLQAMVIFTCPLQSLMHSLATMESNNPLVFCCLGCDYAMLCTYDRMSQSAHQPLRTGTARAPEQISGHEIRPALISPRDSRRLPQIALMMEMTANESFSLVLGHFRSEMFVSFGVQQSTPCSTSDVIARIYLLKFCGGARIFKMVLM